MPKKTADDFLDGPKSADDFLDEKESADDFLGNVAPTPKPSATRSWDEGAPVEDIGAWEEETPLAPAINTQFERKLKSAGGAVGGMVMGIGGAITASGALDKKVLGVGEFEVKLGKSIASYGKRMAEFYQIQDPTFTDKLAAAATSGAVFFVPGYGIAHGVSLLRAAPKLAALIGAGLSSGFESAIEAGLVHETMKEKGASDDDALAAAGKTFAANLALNTGLNYAGGLFRKALPGGASETLKDAVLSAGRASGAESVQEAAQQVISNLTTGEEWAGGVGESALLGGIVGGGMSAVMDVAGAIDQAPGAEAAPGGPEAPTLPIRKNIPEGVLEQAAQMLATDPVSALKNITEPGQWAKVNDLAASVIDDVQAEGIPEDQVQEEVKARLTQIFQETTGTAPEAAEGPPAALQAADAESDAVIQQALTEHDKAQQQAAQVAETDKALTTPEPVSGKPIIDMSEAEYVAAARAEDPELDPEDAARMYEAAMQEAKGLNLVDDQHLAEINDVALQSEADMAQETAVDLPEEHSFDLTPETTQEAGSVPAMTLEEAQGRFPGLTEAQHKSMVQDAVDAYQLAPGDIPKGYEDLRTYAEDKLAAEQKEDFIKEELKRQLAEKGHMTPVLNMLFKNKLDRKRSARYIGGELDEQELRGYFTNKGGLSVSEATERAWVNGWIAEHNDNLLFDEIDKELRIRDVIARRGKEGVITEGVTRGRLGLREEGAKYRPTAAPETSEFKAWFKDSKVVDEQGKPLVVHRGARGLTSLAADNYPGVKFFSDSMGTAQRFADEAKYILTIDGKQRPITEDEFRIISENIEPTETLAWHEGWDLLAETDAKVADKVRAEVGVKDAKSISVTLNKNLVESVYLNLKNPFIYDAQGKTWGEEGIAPELFIKRAKKGGHDGIIAKNIVEGGMADPDLRPTTTYLTFSPNQIKSVNNRGTFDPSSPNIFKSPGQEYAPAGMPAELAEALNLTPAQRYAQSAWHGSPHDFDQFLLHKIGTGEGAQAYGYGLYFAGDRAVAEYYKEGLSRDIATFEKDDKTLSPEEMLKEYFKPGAIVHGYGGRDKVIRFIEKTGDWRSWSVEVQEVNKDGEVIGRKRNHCTVPTTREFTEVLEKAGWKRTAGKLYEVEIPESDKMLDWDKPLSEQTETVKEAIKKGFDKFETLKKELETVNVDSDKYTELFNEFSKYASFKNAIKRPEQYTGNSLYFAMTEGKRDDSARVASETLNSLGIKGIKYLDAISRGKGEGSHNYVIFDDNLIKIINKYSEKPAGHVYQPTEFIIEDDALAPAASQQAVSDVRQVRPVGQWHDLRTDNPAIDQINQQTMEKGFASVIGMKVQTIQDVAEIDGFFIRHPGIEHAVVTKIKNGRITGSKVFTSGKVEFVDPDTKEVQDFVADADEFYMSHNHPSGNATPSQEDIDSTKRMASDKRFKGHVVTDHQTYTAIAPDGTATAQAFREEKQSFRTDIEKMSLSPAIVGWSRGVLEGDRLGIMFVDTQLQVMSFDQVDPRSNYNLYIKRHSTKYGAAGVFLVAGESAASQMAPRHLAGNYHDLLVMKDNGTYESAALGYVPGFTVAEAEGNGLFEASSYAETPGKYNPQDYNRMMGRYKPGMTITLRSRLTSPIVPAGLPRGTAGKLVAVDAKSGEMLVDFDGKILMVNPSLFKETYREPGALQPGQRPLKFIDTVKGMENVAPEVKDSIEGHYDPMTHDASMAEARAILAEDYNKAFKLVFDSGVLTPSTSVTQALSALVFMKAQNEGNFELVEQILKHVAEISKTSGQTIEALKMFRLLTPAGMLRHAENIIEAAQAAGKWGDLLVKMKALGTDEARAAFAKKHGIPHMSKAQADSLYNESAEISKMEEGYDKELATGVMLRHISEMVPKSLWDKVAAVQRMGQLLAFKTFDRNIIGNIGFAVLNNFNQFMVATPLDIAVGKLTGKRTQTIPKWAAYRTGFMTGTVQGAKESWAGVELSVLHNKYDLPNGFTFVNPFMRFAERVLSLSLRATDKAFLFAEKASSVEGQMEVAEMNNEKLKIPTPEILQLAHMDGLYVTFNDPNALRSAMTALKKNLTKISDVVLHTGGRWGAGNQVINYPGTPSSLVMRAVEYSPFNFMQTLYILGRAGVGKGFDQREFIKQTSRAITGSVFLVGTGYIMASLGLITGDDDDPRSIKALKLSTGVRGFQMNISAIIRFISSGMDPAAAKRQPNDLLISYDWFQPAAIGLAMGANMQQSKKRTGELSVLGSTASAAKTITEQPLLQGVSRLFSEGNINIDDEDIKGGRVVGGIMRTLKDTPASFTPQTWNAVQQFADNTSRNARSRDYVTESVNRVKMRIPGLAEDLAPNVDVLGKVRENYQDGSNSFFNVFLNPAFVARYKPTPTTELVLGIWARSGETIQLPRIAPRSIRVQGVKRPLTEWEQAQFQHYIGERTANVFNGLSASEGFMALSDQDKASELRTITTDIYNEAKFKVLGVE